MTDEAFNTRDGTVDFGKDYEYLMAAYYGLTLSFDDEIADFKISTNNNDMGDFDDVVIEFELQNGEQHVCAVQLKHTDRPIAQVTLLAGKKFGLKKYSREFKAVKDKYKKSTSYTASFENFHFILFTDSTVVDCEDIDEKWKKLRPVANGEIVETDILIRKSDDNFGQRLFSVSVTKDNWIYKFKSEKEGSPDEEFFKQFYFYTNQKDAQEMESFIAEIIMKISQNYQSTVLNYLNYFSFWCRRDYGTFKLTKKDVRLKLAELILTPYIPEPNLKKTDPFSEEINSKILQMFSLFDVTLIKDQSEEMINRIWTIVLNKFTEFAEWSSPLSGVYINQLSKVINVPISSLSENFNEISPKKLYILLWHGGLLPLVLRIEKSSEKENILRGIELTRNKDDRKKFILLSEDNPFKWGTNWSILESLSDIYDTDNDNSFIDNLPVSLQGRSPIPLTKFLEIDKRLASTMTISRFLSLVEKGCVGDNYEKLLPKYYVNRLIPKILIDIKAIKELSNDLFVVSIPDPSSTCVFCVDTIEINTYLLLKADKDKTVIYAKDGCTGDQFEKIRFLNEDKNCHYVRFVDNRRLEWVESKGSIKNLQLYRLDYKNFEPCDFISDEEALVYFSKKLNVICADPGMGKSAIMKFLQLECSSQYWVVTVDLNKHINFFKKGHNREEILEYLLAIESDYFVKEVEGIFGSKKQMLFLWDGFDEMPNECLDSVIKTVNILADDGFLQWVAARNNSKKLLEDTFSTLSLTLTHFSPKNQFDYVYFHLKEKYQNEVIDRINEKISAALKCEYFDYTGIPLQIHMLVEIYLRKPENEVSKFHLIGLVDIYQEFIQGKIDSFFRRADADLDNYVMEEIREQFANTQMYEMTAMKASFEEEHLLNVSLRCDELLDELIEDGDSVNLPK